MSTPTTVTIPPGFRAVIVPTEPMGVDRMLELLKKGQPVLCPASKRCWLVGKAKQAGVFTKSRAVEDGVLFEPCDPRPWKE